MIIGGHMTNNEKHNLRARLIITGFVQDVGYRNIVKRIATKMDIKGIVRNISDGNVEIHCKCHDSKHLTQFMDKIRIREDEENLLTPYVKNIEKITHPDDVDKYNPPASYETFSIDYGDISPSDKEIITKLDTGSLIMLKTASNVNDVHGGINDMHRDMKGSFDTMEQRYDKIGNGLDAMHNDLKELIDIIKVAIGYKKDKKQQK